MKNLTLFQHSEEITSETITSESLPVSSHGAISSLGFDPATFPIQRPSRREALDAFASLMTSRTESLVRGSWSTKCLMPSGLTGFLKDGWILKRDTTGMTTGAYGSHIPRMVTDSQTSPSPARNWFEVGPRASLENSKFFKDDPKAALALRKYIAAQFRPANAADLYKHFGARVIYDPCGGWGDRMVAAASIGARYHCRDTNPACHMAYSEIVGLLGVDGITSELAGSEEPLPVRDAFDMAFTSPPYWKQERYASSGGRGPKASHTAFPKFEDWLSGFLMPMVDNCFSAIKSGGVVAINVSDVYANHRWNRIVAPLVSEFGDPEFMWGYFIGSRPASKEVSGDGPLCEPVLIWRKS